MKTNKLKKSKLKKSNKKITHKISNKQNIKPELRKINKYNVLFIKDNTKIITVQSFILNGFINETKENIGISHLLEHVLSNSYKKCKQYNCYEYLNKIGSNSNASTDNNIINYYATSLIKDTDKILKYIINITINPIFDKKLIEKEKEAVHNELLIALDNPRNAVYNKMNKHFFTVDGLKYMDDNQHSINNLKKFNYDGLMKYYKQHYNYKNIIFVVSGNYDNKYITDIFKQNLPHNTLYSSNINYNKMNCFTNKSGIYHIKNLALESTQILLYFPTNLLINSEKINTLFITCYILKDLLFEQLRTHKNLIYHLKLNMNISICGTIVELFVNTKNENVYKVLNGIFNMLNKYKKININNHIIDAAKKRYLVNFYNKKYNVEKYAELYGEQYIYKQRLNTAILSNEELKNSIINNDTNDIKSITNEVFDFNKCMIVYSNNMDPMDHKDITNLL